MNIFTNIRLFFSTLGRPAPLRDWLYVLILLGVALLSFTLYASYIFFGIESGSIINPTSSVPPSAKALTRGEVQNVLEAYRVRKLNYDANNFSTPPLSDPAGNFGTAPATSKSKVQ